MSAIRTLRTVFLPTAFVLAVLGAAPHASRAADDDGAADAARLDPRIRFAVLTEAGPLLVHVDLLFDGEPYRILRGELIDEILRRADADGDGVATWAELLKNPPATASGLVTAAGNAQFAAAYQRQWDVDKDGLVDEAEADRLLSGISGSSVAAFPPTSQLPQPDLLAVLDANGDGRLSPQELDGAAARLQARDVDDDEDVDPQELAPQGPYRPVRPVGQGATTPRLLDLVPARAAIVETLRARYGHGTVDRERRPLLARRADELDRDADGTLDDAELARIADLPADLMLRVDLGRSRERATTIEVVRDAGLDLRPASSPGVEPALEIVLPGCTLRLAAALSQVFDFRQNARQQISFYDKDANGYLEKSELPEGNAGRFVLAQFERWDADKDGKVYEADIAADLERGQLPRLSQASCASQLVPPSLWTAVDQVPDGRLGIREMRAVAARLRALDRNGDGTLQPSELPESLTVTIGRGNAVFGVRPPAIVPGTSPAAGGSGPKWFVHMDRNGDGDVSPREFLGPAETFRRLDRDDDGLIDASEAAQAASAAIESRR